MAFKTRVVSDVVVLLFVMRGLVWDGCGAGLANLVRGGAGTGVAGESCGGGSKEHSFHDVSLSAGCQSLIDRHPPRPESERAYSWRQSVKCCPG
jgi:hypothetical protein